MLALAPAALAGNIGTFTQASDVGTVKPPVTAAHDSLTGTYTLGASGANIWDTHDAFGYLWKQVHGDVTFGATVNLKGKGGHAHRKAGVMFRQSLEPDSPYVDIVVHGDGLTSLQYRSEPGGPTREIQCATGVAVSACVSKSAATTCRSALANDVGLFSASGCGIRIALRGTSTRASWCARMTTRRSSRPSSNTSRSARLPRKPRSGCRPSRFSTLDRCNAASSTSREPRPMRRVSPSTVMPSVFAAKASCSGSRSTRPPMPEIIGPPNADTVAIAAASAPPALRLTHEVKGGHAQIWRATAGGAQSPVTKDKLQNWQPRLAPSGESFVFLSGSARPDGGRIAPGDYLLREMPAMGGTPRELAAFFGGPGSLGRRALVARRHAHCLRISRTGLTLAARSGWPTRAPARKIAAC